MISMESKDNCTIFKATGEVTANEITIQAAEYMADGPTDNSMWDFSEATRVRITTLEMQGVAESLKTVIPDGKARKVALVSSKHTNIGLGKIFTAFAQIAGLPHDYKVFRNRSLAEQWLAE